MIHRTVSSWWRRKYCRVQKITTSVKNNRFVALVLVIVEAKRWYNNRQLVELQSTQMGSHRFCANCFGLSYFWNMKFGGTIHRNYPNYLEWIWWIYHKWDQFYISQLSSLRIAFRTSLSLYDWLMWSKRGMSQSLWSPASQWSGTVNSEPKTSSGTEPRKASTNLLRDCYSSDS